MVPLNRNASLRYTLLILRAFCVGLAVTTSALQGAAAANPNPFPPETPADPSADAQPEYTRMIAAVGRYERIAASGGWPTIPAGPTIEPGSDDPRVPLLVQRLLATGDLANDVPIGAGYDAVVEAAVLKFQSRHGLAVDGLVGKKTLRAMNIPVATRVARLRINVERLRAVFQADREDFLLVNVPAYEIYRVSRGTSVWAEKVIVGEPETKTPLFESAVTHVVFNPTWTVPRKIAIEELVPKIRDDNSFPARGGYIVVDTEKRSVNPSDIDWASLHENNFPYTLIQSPGPMNELGRIKFLIPNNFGIGMHDTPSRYLFANASRAFSHGCIRVAEPVRIAERLLETDGWTREMIERQIDSGETHSVALSAPMPLLVTYLTARVSQDGTVYFYDDIYDRDVVTQTSLAPERAAC